MIDWLLNNLSLVTVAAWILVFISIAVGNGEKRE